MFLFSWRMKFPSFVVNPIVKLEWKESLFRKSLNKGQKRTHSVMPFIKERKLE